MPANTTARYENQTLSTLGDRLVVRFFNHTYTFNLRTRTWHEWSSSGSPVRWHIFGPLIRAHAEVHEREDTYFTSYSFDTTDGYKIIKIFDGLSVSDVEGFGEEDIECLISTKDFDMADPVRFKRLFWWGADVLTGNEIVGDVKPIVLNFQPTWNDLSGFSINDLGTWGAPLAEPSVTSTVIPGDNNFLISKAPKLGRSLRFRKVNFSLRLLTNGSILQPAKVFAIVAVVKTKQKITAKVS
jgi:hypothetical protein